MEVLMFIALCLFLFGMMYGDEIIRLIDKKLERDKK